MEESKMTIEQVLQTRGTYVGPTMGVSMLPMLKTGRDTIVVQKKTDRLQPLDVALYKRGNDYVLHRVISVVDDGYIIRGDNCYNDENVPEETVIGVLTEFFQANKHVNCTDENYLAYARKRVKNYKRRRFFIKIRAFGGKILRKLKLRK